MGFSYLDLLSVIEGGGEENGELFEVKPGGVRSYSQLSAWGPRSDRDQILGPYM